MTANATETVVGDLTAGARFYDEQGEWLVTDATSVPGCVLVVQVYTGATRPISTSTVLIRGNSGIMNRKLVVR